MVKFILYLLMKFIKGLCIDFKIIEFLVEENFYYFYIRK